MKTLGGVKSENGVSSKEVSTPNSEPEKIDFSKVKVEPLFEEDVDFDTFSKSDFRAVKVIAVIIFVRLERSVRSDFQCTILT